MIYVTRSNTTQGTLTPYLPFTVYDESAILYFNLTASH